MTDNGQTPHLVVDAEVEGVSVPRQYVRDGKIVLNASYEATSALSMKNDWVIFGARFGGVAHEVRVPMPAVLGIYARETGQGMIFADEDPVDTPPDAPDPKPPPGGSEEPKRPRLTVVK